MPDRNKPEGKEIKAEKVLAAGPIAWTISSKSGQFAPLKCTLRDDARVPGGRRMFIEPVKNGADSSSSSSSTSAPGPSKKTSTSSSSFLHLLPEISCTSSELSALASDWSGESAQSSIASPPPSSASETERKPLSTTTNLPREGAKSADKGKGPAVPDKPAPNLQPHYQSMLDP